MNQINEILDINHLADHDERYGLFIFNERISPKESFLHLVNINASKKRIKIKNQNEILFEGKVIEIHKKARLMLPLNLELDDIIIIYSTAELIDS